MKHRTVLAVLTALLAASSPAATTPNVVIVYCDDLGYGDVACNGATDVRTPNIDRIAAEGVRFTSFYVAQAVCSASRAALMTGCLPNRIGILGALGPNAPTGISSNEITVAELLKSRGYTCGIFGKWHLGSAPQFLPLRHGFDEYFGLPYSNDMWPFDWQGRPSPARGKDYPDLRLIDGNARLPEPVDTLARQATLTRQYTRRAVSFIERNRDHPFFLYFPHSMPHTPIASAPPYRGKSARGLYGDVVEEIDHSVGELLAALDRTGTASNTLVMFSSDNGPWLRFGNWGGSAGPLREGKGTMFEGGCREPCVIRWPGHIRPGRTDNNIVCTVDILPTLAAVTGAALPDHPIDGRNQLPLLEDEKAKAPRDTFVYYYGNELQAVRQGQWKYHFRHTVGQSVEGLKPGMDGVFGPAKQIEFGPALFDLNSDIGERKDLLAENPEVAARLEKIGREHAATIQRERREPGKLTERTSAGQP
jgi:arylsulfatase A